MNKETREAMHRVEDYLDKSYVYKYKQGEFVPEGEPTLFNDMTILANAFLREHGGARKRVKPNQRRRPSRSRRA